MEDIVTFYISAAFTYFFTHTIEKNCNVKEDEWHKTTTVIMGERSKIKWLLFIVMTLMAMLALQYLFSTLFEALLVWNSKDEPLRFVPGVEQCFFSHLFLVWAVTALGFCALVKRVAQQAGCSIGSCSIDRYLKRRASVAFVVLYAMFAYGDYVEYVDFSQGGVRFATFAAQKHGHYSDCDMKSICLCDDGILSIEFTDGVVWQSGGVYLPEGESVRLFRLLQERKEACVQG